MAKQQIDTMPDLALAPGYGEHQAAQQRLAELRNDLRQVEADLEQSRHPQLRRQQVREMAVAVMNGGSAQTITMERDNPADLTHRIEVLKEAVALAEQQANAKQRLWATAATESLMPSYRKLAAEYAKHISEAARIARTMQAMNDDLNVQCDRSLPTAGRHLLKPSDENGPLYYAAAEWLQLGIVRPEQLKNGLPV